MFFLIPNSESDGKSIQYILKTPNKKMKNYEFIVYRDNVNFAHHSNINQEKVYLEGKWEEYQISHICPLIKEWKMSHLGISQKSFMIDSNKNIFSEIKEISFPHLLNLNLTGNKTGSLEGFNRISMPMLK